MTSTVRPDRPFSARRTVLRRPTCRCGEIDLGALDFWAWDDDRRDGAFATLRRESPITFFEARGVRRLSPEAPGTGR